MAEMVLNTDVLPELLTRLIPTQKIRVKKIDEIVQLVPIDEKTDCTIGLRGILAGYDDMSVDKFLERKRMSKELDI